MNCKIGIIATSLLVCSLAGPVGAEMSEAPAAGAEAPGSAGGEAGINSLLDRFAGTGLSNPSSDERNNSSLSNILPISETTLASAFTRAGSPMNAYYSRSGTDDSGFITAFSRSTAIADSVAGGNNFFPSESGLAASVRGFFVGSGAVVQSAEITPMQPASSGQSVIRGNSIIHDTPEPPQNVPLPLPFMLTGSGLAALLGLRKRK